MALAVVTVASGGVPVVDVTATSPKRPARDRSPESIAITKVTLLKGGLPVTYVAGPLLRAGTVEDRTRMVELEEFEPNRWRVKKDQLRPIRSNLPLPYVISDHMDPVEQFDGQVYTSKSEFRRVGRSHGLTEVGNEKIKPKVRGTRDPAAKTARRAAIGKAISQYKAGRRI